MTMPGFSGQHDLRGIGGGNWYLLSSFTYTSLTGESFVAPEGSITDGASTAFLFGHLNLFPTAAQNTQAATLHDVHYRTGKHFLPDNSSIPITRKQADQLFSEGLELENLYIQSLIGYIGLRLFGFLAWNANARKRK